MIKYCALCGVLIDGWGDSVELGVCPSCRKEKQREEEEKKKSEQKPGKKDNS